MRETDISKFTEQPEKDLQAENTALRVLKVVGRVLFTLFIVGVFTGIVVGTSMVIYIGQIAAEPTGINLRAKSLNQTSFIYVKNKDGEFKKYKSLYSTENRVWVNFKDIPQHMKDAQIAIEDKRFYDHHGVDWTRTAGAVLNLSSGEASYGGSTMTQQLIKNISDDNDVSLNRKLREIVKAIKLEDEYTKDEILEAYLNVVNYGNNCQGVQSAANLYFGKDIGKCSIAQCAAIAGITQNPSRFNPLIYPEYNKERRELVLHEMYDQGKLTDKEYKDALKESEKMTFVGFKKSNKATKNQKVQNWYLDLLQKDLESDLSTYYNISEKAASDKIFTEGLKIYCAMDVDAQDYIEKVAQEELDTSYDSGLQCAMTMVGTDGSVIATVGSSQEKTTNLSWDRATDSVLQPGSSIKPVVVYPLAIERGELHYSAVVKDEPLEKYKVVDGEYVAGPDNWYDGYKGNMLLPDAIEWSANATAVQVIDKLAPSNAYTQAVTLQGFTHLSEQDKHNAGGLSIGGLNGGVTVREMAAAFTYMINGGKYYKPYTYYYVTDAEGNTIIDNRNQIPKTAYSPETAYIMNRLLSYNMTYCAHTNAYLGRVEDWDIIGKTGTTDEDKDSWFCGCSPYAALAVWTGFDTPETISMNGQQNAASMFSKVMGHYLEGKKQKDYPMPSSIIEANYDPSNGAVYNVGDPSPGQYVGYYTEENVPSEGDGGEYVDYYYGEEYAEEDEGSEGDGEEIVAEEETSAEEEAGEEETEGEAEEEEPEEEAPPEDEGDDGTDDVEEPPEVPEEQENAGNEATEGA